MSWKSTLIKPYARYVAAQTKRWSNSAVQDQQICLNTLIKQASNTNFGKSHSFESIKNQNDFIKNVPLRSYEDFQPWLEKIFDGESHVLWPGRPIYFAKSSGTTAGAKYIPISRDSIAHHFFSAQTASLLYMEQTGAYKMMDSRMLFLSGSPILKSESGVPTGRLSGIVNHHIPNYLSKNKLPDYQTNCIKKWEEKLDEIVEQSLTLDLSLIGGIPPWVQMYFDKLIEKSGQSISELFPNLKLLVHGGVNFKPYEKRLIESTGKPIDMVETYPASEGFFAFQDNYKEEGLLLNTKAGIYFEFVPLEQISSKNPDRLTIKDVELKKQYALVISTNAGLWSYIVGDTICFTSLNPFRIKVSGRINHFLSAFGEHVIAQEVENAIVNACKHFNTSIEEFTVAPKMAEENELPYHEWVIASSDNDFNKKRFADFLDSEMCLQNIYYKDLIEGNVLQKLKIRWTNSTAFHRAMDEQGKLGGQNKSPRLMNNRLFIDLLLKYI